MPTVSTQSVIIRANLGSQVVYSLTDDRADPEPLGDVVTGTIYPFLEPSDDIATVTWYVDDAFYSTRTDAPFDIEGDTAGAANPFETNLLDPRAHLLAAVLDRDDGQTETVYAYFTVAHDPSPTPAIGVAVIGTPFIDVLGDPDADVLPNVVAAAVQIGTPAVTTGTVNRAKAGIGVFPRGAAVGGTYDLDDDNLVYLETSAYLNKKFGTGFSHVREILAKTGWAGMLSTANAFMTDTAGLRSLRDRNPNPVSLELFFPLFVEAEGYKASIAAKRACFQASANGDYDSHYQDFVNICTAGGWGTSSANLWLETFHEFDTPGIQNPAAINNGNVDVAVAAMKHVSQFFHARLPQVKICGGRISNTNTEYLLAGGVPSGKTFLDVFMQEWESYGNPSQWIDLLYQNVYDSAQRTESQHTTRINEVYAYCQKWSIPFGMAEWGLFAYSNNGNGDNPSFIQFIYDIQNAKPLFSHSHYFEGLDITGMLENNFTNSLARFRSLFGTP